LLHALYQQKSEQSFLELTYHPVSPENKGTSDTQVLSLLEQIVREDLERQIGYEHIRQGFLIRLLQRLCTDYSPVRHSTRQEGKEKALLYDLERYIRLHDADVTISELEQVFHYHRNYFNLILRKYRGQTFQKYVQKVRLDHAVQLLKESSLPIRQVALAVGYENTSYFYHIFEERFGVPPQKMRQE
ncbi:AraC family transcriptional regulator, partial [Lachnospiraceae bacterium]|nr:AraC family transcriptional regulator [Lachnospiraceae bacterium]